MQIGIAGAAGLVEGVAGHAGQGRRAHDAQQFGQGAASVGVHGHHGMAQIGNLRIHFCQPHAGRAREAAGGAAHLHRRALENQFTPQLRKGRPGQRVGRLQPGRDIGVHHVFDACGYAELALARVVEGDVVQIALYAELDVACAAGLDGIAHIVARVGGNAQGQVAVHPRAVGPAQRAREIHHAGEVGKPGALAGVAGVPGGAQLALRVGIGKSHIAGVDGDALPVHLPAHLGAELVERQHRVFKDSRQDQRARGNGQARLAAAVRHVDVHIRTPKPRHGVAGLAVPSGQCEALHLAAHLVLLQCVERAAPRGVHVVHETFGGVCLQSGVRGGPEGQAAADLRQRGEVEPVCPQLALGERLPCGARVLQAQIASGPHEAIVGNELQPLGVELETTFQAPPPQPSFDGRQRQRLELGPQRGVDVGQRQVGRAADDLPTLHVGPGAQSASSLRDFDPHVRMVPQP